MTRNRLLVALGVALAVLVAVSLWLALGGPGEPGIDRAHYDRIKLGMRLDEVEAILSIPPGDHRTGPRDEVLAVSVEDGEGLDAKEDQLCSWCGDHAILRVWLDPEGRVSSKELKKIHPPGGPCTLDLLWHFVIGR